MIMDENRTFTRLIPVHCHFAVCSACTRFHGGNKTIGVYDTGKKDFIAGSRFYLPFHFDDDWLCKILVNVHCIRAHKKSLLLCEAGFVCTSPIGIEPMLSG